MNIAVLDGWKVLNAARMCRNNKPARQRRTGTPGLVPSCPSPLPSHFSPVQSPGTHHSFPYSQPRGCQEVGVANTIEHIHRQTCCCLRDWKNFDMMHRCFSCSFLASTAAFSLVSLELSPQNCVEYHTTTESSIREAIASFYRPYSLQIRFQYPLLRLIICIWK